MTSLSNSNATPKVNDFSIHVGTVNGSGSQSSNNVLMRAIFRMGIPVNGKNLFPSNIQGLPTWFTIRVNKDGWTARKVQTDILVCMNDQTYVDDVKQLSSGAIVVHHDHMNVAALRKDVTSLPVPFSKIIAEACADPRLRKLAVNMVYVGIVAELIGITDEAIELAMVQQFKSKQKVIELNRSAIQAGRKYVQTTWPDFGTNCEKFPYRVEPMNKTQGKILIEGNAAAALGSIFAGCSFVSWYPITPSTSLIDFFQEYSEKYRIDPVTKRKNFAVVQAEDEMAAIGMVLGASWMGARSMTATSGPGISLMAEFTGFGYFAEVPAVIFDIQRVGPSTGLPTRTSQGEVLFAAILSHGDTKNICIYPGSVEECYRLSAQAFDLAERFQTPVFVLSDLDLGMNFHMSEPFAYLDQPLDRGKVLTDADQEKLATFARYGDIDGDGVAYRTLPGLKDPRGVFFTRGSGHNAKAAYTESGVEYKAAMDRLAKKWETAKKYVPAPILKGSGKNKMGIIAYGSSEDGVMESLHQLKTEFGMELDYLRIRAYPFSSSIKDFMASHDRIFVVDQNRDAQMLSLLRMEKDLTPFVTRLESILHYDGMPLDARFVTDAILAATSAGKNSASQPEMRAS
jgi:2-oxoglutarate ferredoxin oxidoreductase subunit alpha